MPKEDPEEVTIITTKDKIQTYIRQNYVSKKLIQDKIKELEEQTHKIINTTYIPNCSEIFNKNKEKYEPMLEARNILINALNGLKELLKEK